VNLLDKLTANLEPVKEKSDTVEEALKKALDNTTPERPGTPWDKKCQQEQS
jgi:hypothetical protein